MEIVPQINGRLGNQLHQICTAFGIAKRFGYKVKLLKGTFSYTNKFLHKFPEVDSIDTFKEYHVDNFKYVEPKCPTDQFVHIKGYNLSYKYHISDREELTKIFSPVKEIEDLTLFQYNGCHGNVGCGIHIRRGDYVGNDYYAQIPIDYYRETAKKIDHKVDFYLIFSDEIGWVKENLTLNTDKPIYFSGNSDAVTDNCLLRLCPYKILSNSSFSFFSAYFSKSVEVYYPSEWMYHSGFNIEDYCLNDWNKVEV